MVKSKRTEQNAKPKGVFEVARKLAKQAEQAACAKTNKKTTLTTF